MDESFGKYRLTQLIATGGMAEVFLAVEKTPHSERHVVIKRILPSYANDPDFIEFFLHEARLALQLNHPNVVQTYELGEEKGTYYLAMEYVRGETALSLIRRAGQRGAQLSLDAVAKIGADVIAALDHVHAARDVNGTPLEIVHRDVSPHNIVVSTGGVAKLVDFGIARAACQEFRTRTGVVKGKFAYLAPEQLQRGRHFDHRADLFSLGIVLYEMLTRRPLFRGATDADTMNRILSGRIPPLRELRPETPPAFAAVVEKALERDPDRRYASAGAMLADLDEATRLSGLFPSMTRLRDEVENLFSEEEPPTVANARALPPGPSPLVVPDAPRAGTRLPGPPVARTTALPVGAAPTSQRPPTVPMTARPAAPPRASRAEALAPVLPPPKRINVHVPLPAPPARVASATPTPVVDMHAAGSPFPAPASHHQSSFESEGTRPSQPPPASAARGASDGWVPERDTMLEHFLRLAGARRPVDRASTLPLRAVRSEAPSVPRSIAEDADDIELALRKALGPAAAAIAPLLPTAALPLPPLALPLPAPDDTPPLRRPPALIVESADAAYEFDDPEIEPDDEPDTDLELNDIHELSEELTASGPGLENVALELPRHDPQPAGEITGTTAPESIPSLKARRRRRQLAAILAFMAVAAALSASLLNLL